MSSRHVAANAAVASSREPPPAADASEVGIRTNSIAGGRVEEALPRLIVVAILVRRRAHNARRQATRARSDQSTSPTNGSNGGQTGSS